MGEPPTQPSLPPGPAAIAYANNAQNCKKKTESLGDSS